MKSDLSAFFWQGLRRVWWRPGWGGNVCKQYERTIELSYLSIFRSIWWDAWKVFLCVYILFVKVGFPPIGNLSLGMFSLYMWTRGSQWVETLQCNVFSHWLTSCSAIDRISIAEQSFSQWEKTLQSSYHIGWNCAQLYINNGPSCPSICALYITPCLLLLTSTPNRHPSHKHG